MCKMDCNYHTAHRFRVHTQNSLRGQRLPAILKAGWEDGEKRWLGSGAMRQIALAHPLRNSKTRDISNQSSSPQPTTWTHFYPSSHIIFAIELDSQIRLVNPAIIKTPSSFRPPTITSLWRRLSSRLYRVRDSSSISAPTMSDTIGKWAPGSSCRSSFNWSYWIDQADSNALFLADRRTCVVPNRFVLAKSRPGTQSHSQECKR